MTTLDDPQRPHRRRETQTTESPTLLGSQRLRKKSYVHKSSLRAPQSFSVTLASRRPINRSAICWITIVVRSPASLRTPSLRKTRRRAPKSRTNGYERFGWARSRIVGNAKGTCFKCFPPLSMRTLHSDLVLVLLDGRLWTLPV